MGLNLRLFSENWGYFKVILALNFNVNYKSNCQPLLKATDRNRNRNRGDEEEELNIILGLQQCA